MSGRSSNYQFRSGNHHSRSNWKGIVKKQKSNEDRECRTIRIGQHHRAVSVRSCAQMGKLSGGASQSTANGWNMNNHCSITFGRHMRERIQFSLYVVMLSEGEERGV